MSHLSLNIPAVSFLVLVSLVTVGCQSGSEPVVSGVPVGMWTYSSHLPDGRFLKRSLDLRYDSAVISDTIFRSQELETVDSTHLTLLQLEQGPDGYHRVIEWHQTGDGEGSRLFRYWFFFQRDGLLHHYRGFRFYGTNPSLLGEWTTAPEDAEAMGYALHWRFEEEKLFLQRIDGNDTTLLSGRYEVDGRTLVTEPEVLIPVEPRRLEILPGYALYLTSHGLEAYSPVSVE